jgi:hypothetical protein
MHVNATLYSADMLQCRYMRAVLLCRTPLDSYRRTKQRRTVVLCGSMFCKQASYSEVRVSWPSLVSTSERHRSDRKCGRNSILRTHAYQLSRSFGSIVRCLRGINCVHNNADKFSLTTAATVTFTQQQV